jgi:nucleoside-diphosphate-sugar epimerase
MNGRGMRYFVTGATGFIGGHLARQLVSADHDVVALVRELGRAPDLDELGVELVVGDLLDRETIRAALDGVDGVFHVAGWYKVGVPDRSEAEAVNVHGTRTVLEAAHQTGVPKIVYTSTLAVLGDTGGRVVEGDPRHEGPWVAEYDRTKWLAHYEVALPMIEEGLPLVIVLPGYVYGPGDPSNVGVVLREYLRRRLPVKPAHGACWSHVEDSAHGHILAMEHGRIGVSYALAGECRYWAEVLDIARELTGIRPPRVTLPPLAARISAALLKPLSAVIPLPRMYHPETLGFAAGITYFADDTRARRDLGWTPRPLSVGLAQTLEAERASTD